MSVDAPFCDPDLLVRLVRSEDREALDRITLCYGDRLLLAGRRHCRTEAEAEDAVQDALATATEKLSTFRGEGSLEGWLVRIVARACRRMSRGRKNDGSAHVSLPVLSSDGVDPESDAAGRELQALLADALTELSPTDRGILLLAEVEDWTAPEIGSQLGLSAGAVRTRLTRTRAKLRSVLAAALA